jgi:hypothetical protein
MAGVTLGQVLTRLSSSVSFHQCSIFMRIFMLLVPDGQMAEAWEPSKKQCYFENRGALDRKVLPVFSFFASMS